jgi:hypothetical protein
MQKLQLGFYERSYDGVSKRITRPPTTTTRTRTTATNSESVGAEIEGRSERGEALLVIYKIT